MGAGLARRVVITGFMCAGKTTVARELAKRLGCSMLDLDELITSTTGRTPRALIDEDGEAAFRAVESAALRRALEEHTERVVALGGGAWTLERNRALIAEHDCLTVWLDTPFDLCWVRIEGEGGGEARPLARDRDGARMLYDERRAAYGLAALRVRVEEGRDAASVAAEIAGALSTNTQKGDDNHTPGAGLNT